MKKRTDLIATTFVAIFAGLVWVIPPFPRSELIAYFGILGLLISALAVARLFFLFCGRSQKGQVWMWVICLLSFSAMFGGTFFGAGWAGSLVSILTRVLLVLFAGGCLYGVAARFSGTSEGVTGGLGKWGKRAVIGAVALTLGVIALVLIDWSSGRISARAIAAAGTSDYESMELCQQRRCERIDPVLWQALLTEIGNMQTLLPGGNWRDPTETRYVLRFHSETLGEFSIRIWERRGSKRWSVASIQKSHRGGTAFYGDYAGEQIMRWVEEAVIEGG